MIEKLFPLFKDKPEAWHFIMLYLEYVHAIDDLVDEDFNLERLLKAFYLASLLYSCDYFYRNRAALITTEHTIINTYADSVRWEKSDSETKQKWADAIRHCGIEMILKVVQLELGWEALRSISEIVRERVFNT